MAIIASDSFNRADSSTTLGSTDNYAGGSTLAWSAEIGTWGISSNQAWAVSTGGSELAVVNHGSNDQQVTADLTPTGAGDTSVVAQYSDTTHYYLGQYQDPNVLNLYKNNGGFTLLASSGAALTGTHTFSLKCVASAQTIYVDGVSTLTATDSAVPAGTKAGFRNGGAVTADRFDNLQVDDLASVIPPRWDLIHPSPVYRM